jgi:phage terminase Nu1 subunit (DNA packaging protein)
MGKGNKFKSRSKASLNRKSKTLETREHKRETFIVLSFRDFDINQGQDFEEWEEEKLLALMINKLRAICQITMAQATAQQIIKPYTKWIRSFSCTDGNELIPQIAHEYGIKTMVGAWLGSDDEINKKEIANLIEIAKKGYVDLAAVGNEVIYREELEEQELIDYINYVKRNIVNIPVG